jgi:hypothetical protein
VLFDSLAGEFGALASDTVLRRAASLENVDPAVRHDAETASIVTTTCQYRYEAP